MYATKYGSKSTQVPLGFTTLKPMVSRRAEALKGCRADTRMSSGS